MTFYIKLPLIFLRFWFIEAPFLLMHRFASFNHSFLRLVSMPILFKTFFHPLKNEYRKGLVGFSIGMGIAVKSVLLAADTVLFLSVLFAEAIIFIVFFALPILTFYILTI